LKPLDEDDEEFVNVVIETPKGCRNKYAFDQDEHVFRLKKVLPTGMTFPYDFGFLPSTEADDGDPVDVLVLMDEPAFTGCVVQCRLVGVIEGEQEEGKETVRNDRLLAIETQNHAWAKIKHVDDLGKKFLKELEEFFVNYHRLSGKKYRVLDVKGPAAAQKCAEQGMKANRKR
jgi:inorganic pyrophosphatase